MLLKDGVTIRYYAYTIDGDTITIQDACHAQNMHE